MRSAGSGHAISGDLNRSLGCGRPYRVLCSPTPCRRCSRSISCPQEPFPIAFVNIVGQSSSIAANLPACSGTYWNNCFGAFTYEDGSTYIGEWKKDKRNGQGTATFPNGAKYVGEFKDDKANGQGTLTFPNGEKYVGEFKDDKKHGQGTYTWHCNRPGLIGSRSNISHVCSAIMALPISQAILPSICPIKIWNMFAERPCIHKHRARSSVGIKRSRAASDSKIITCLVTLSRRSLTSSATTTIFDTTRASPT